MKPLVSVIIPVYNIEKYIEICLNSVVNQTYENLEIICVDDGSADKSGEIIKAIAEKDSRVKYFYQENAGVSAARNLGLEKVTGDYVIFVDSDDYVHPQFVECELKVAIESDADIVCVTEKAINEHPVQVTMVEKIKPCSEIINVDELLKKKLKCVYVVTGNMYKYSLIQEIRFRVDLHNGEDSIFMLLAMLNADKIVLADFSTDIKYYYLVRENSLSSCQTFTMRKADLVDAAAECYEICSKANDDFLKADYLKGIYRVILRQRIQCHNSKCKKEVTKKLNQMGKKYLKALKKDKNLTRLEKIGIILMFEIPLLYRFFLFILNQKCFRNTLLGELE